MNAVDIKRDIQFSHPKTVLTKTLSQAALKFLLNI
jgi:hypothetical protein